MSEPRISELRYDRTSRAEQKLWATVLHSLVHDICAPHRDPFARRDAERWVGEYPCSDFREVTSLAGFDPDAVWEKLSKIIALPHEDRRWVRDVSVQARADNRSLNKQKKDAA